MSPMSTNKRDLADYWGQERINKDILRDLQITKTQYFEQNGNK